MRRTNARKAFCGGLELSVTVTVNLYSPVEAALAEFHPGRQTSLRNNVFHGGNSAVRLELEFV